MPFSHIWITLPLVGAFIGWITNLIAVRMLFHPREEKRFLFFKIQGVFPKRQKDLAHKLGELVATELFSAADVVDAIRSKASSEDIISLISKHLREAIQHRVPQLIPMAGMFLTPQLLDSLEGAFKPELHTMVDSLVSRFGDTMGDVIDIRTVVRERVNAFSSDKLEQLILTLMKKELTFVEYIGGVLGFIIGVFQAAIAVW